jgi:hypothetical protein
MIIDVICGHKTERNIIKNFMGKLMNILSLSGKKCNSDGTDVSLLGECTSIVCGACIINILVAHFSLYVYFFLNCSLCISIKRNWFVHHYILSSRMEGCIGL